MAVPTSRIVEVADEFVTELNTVLAGWGVVTPQTPPADPLPVVAERKFSTAYAIDELSVLHIDVQISTLEEEIGDRKPTCLELYGINVVIQQHVDPTDVSAITGLTNLVVAIFKHWPKQHTVGTFDTVSVANSEVLVYSPTLLDEDTRYFGVVGFQFQEML